MNCSISGPLRAVGDFDVDFSFVTRQQSKYEIDEQLAYDGINHSDKIVEHQPQAQLIMTRTSH